MNNLDLLSLSTWGESILLMTQYAAMMSLMCIYHGRHRDAIIFMVGYISVVVGLLGGVVGEEGVVGLKVGGLAAAIWLKVRGRELTHILSYTRYGLECISLEHSMRCE